MPEFIALVLNMMSFGLIAMMIAQAFTRKVELISYRNLYLGGFIVFQLFSGATVIANEDYGSYVIEYPSAGHTVFLLYALVFTLVFLVSYHGWNFSGWLAGWFRPRHTYEVNDWLFLLTAVGVAFLAVAARFFGGYFPYLHYILSFAPIAPLAAGMVGWVWGGRRFNLAVVLLGGAVIAICVFVSMYGIAGRRPLLAVCMALIWGAYFRLRQSKNLVTIIVYLTPFVIAMTFLVGAFTLVRGMNRAGADPLVVINKALGASSKDAFGEVAEGSADARSTLWAIDAYPRRYEMRHLFSLKFMLYHPIPRELWSKFEHVLGPKPVPLSLLVAPQAHIKGVKHGVITLPPGVLGYARAEGGFYALLIYAVFYGQFTRFFDVIVRQNFSNPFLVLAIGCTLGDLIGLARGDLAIFGNLVWLGFLFCWFTLLVIRVFLGRIDNSSSPPLHL